MKKFISILLIAALFCTVLSSCNSAEDENKKQQAIEKYGCIKGIIKGIFRILKCNPFSKGGYDPLN